MALPWLALIKAVPWTDVVAHAPAVLNGAKKLWQRQPNGTGHLGKPGRPGGGTADADRETGTASAARVADVEAQLAEALGQLSSTNQLVQDMAEQQARMLVQIDANRKALGRMRWVAAVALVLAGVAMFKVFSAA